MDNCNQGKIFLDEDNSKRIDELQADLAKTTHPFPLEKEIWILGDDSIVLI